MRWDDRLVELFEDLEQQAEGLHLAERDAELADRSRSEYATVTFASRMHASVGSQVTLSVAGVGVLLGQLARVGPDWCLLETTSPAQEWVVALQAVRVAGGLSEQAVHDVAVPVVARLSMRSVLRGIADSRSEMVLHHLEGTITRGRLGRAGADFVEVISQPDHAGTRPPPRAAEVVPLAMLAAARRA